jgi:hypothetical protein
MSEGLNAHGCGQGRSPLFDTVAPLRHFLVNFVRFFGYGCPGRKKEKKKDNKNIVKNTRKKN